MGRKASDKEKATQHLYYLKHRELLKAKAGEYYEANKPRISHRRKLKHKRSYVRVVHGKEGSVRYEAKLAGYKSGFERTLAASMEMRKVAFSYEDTKVPYVLEREYNPDFHLLDKNIYIEAKGLLDREAKAKMAAVKKQHPDLDIRIVFMDAQKKVPGSKQTHGQWAERNGYMWADREIPEEWLNE